jgi:copper resistance protein B
MVHARRGLPAGAWLLLAIVPWTAHADDMSSAQMAGMMEMDDQSRVGRVLVDDLEFRDGAGADGAFWDAQGQYGNDFNKLVVRTEGNWESATQAQGRVELLWDRIISRWWSLQAGGRYDFGDGPGRGWAAFGIAGLAPYWINVEATMYLGDAGTVAARVKAETDLLMTQRLILQPELELNAYSRSDSALNQGAGLSELQAGLRLRYAIRREVAPYVGIAWTRRFAELPNALQWVAGIRMLF